MSEFNNRVLDFLQAPTSLLTLAPTVGDFAPHSGCPGTSVTVYGEGFVQTT
jgi:hypothetical protein